MLGSIGKKSLEHASLKGAKEFSAVCEMVAREVPLQELESKIESLSHTIFEKNEEGNVRVRESTVDELKEVLGEVNKWQEDIGDYLHMGLPMHGSAIEKMAEKLGALEGKILNQMKEKERQAEIRQQLEEEHTEAYEGAKARYNERSTFKKFLDKITGRAPDWNKVMELSNDEMNKLYQRKGDRSERNSGDDRSF